MGLAARTLAIAAAGASIAPVAARATAWRIGHAAGRRALAEGDPGLASELLREAFGRAPPDAPARSSLVEDLYAAGAMLAEGARVADAVDVLRLVLPARRRRWGADSADLEPHLSLLGYLEGRTEGSRRREDRVRAAAHLEEARAILARTRGEDDPETRRAAAAAARARRAAGRGRRVGRGGRGEGPPPATPATPRASRAAAVDPPRPTAAPAPAPAPASAPTPASRPVRVAASAPRAAPVRPAADPPAPAASPTRPSRSLPGRGAGAPARGRYRLSGLPGWPESAPGTPELAPGDELFVSALEPEPDDFAARAAAMRSRLARLRRRDPGTPGAPPEVSDRLREYRHRLADLERWASRRVRELDGAGGGPRPGLEREAARRLDTIQSLTDAAGALRDRADTRGAPRLAAAAAEIEDRIAGMLPFYARLTRLDERGGS